MDDMGATPIGTFQKQQRRVGLSATFDGELLSEEAHVGIQVGDPAPDFTLPKQDGTKVNLGELLKTKAVVLYFYPHDDTPGCTVEACAFRDAYQDFTDAGAEVVGISSDSATSHDGFAKKYKLPFTLVADEGGAVRKAYGVPKSMLGFLPGRVTYVIDRQGKVRHTFNSQLNPKKHVQEALDVLKQLRGA
jgi:peroxiredoxin Q/BCP